MAIPIKVIIFGIILSVIAQKSEAIVCFMQPGDVSFTHFDPVRIEMGMAFNNKTIGEIRTQGCPPGSTLCFVMRGCQTTAGKFDIRGCTSLNNFCALFDEKCEHCAVCNSGNLCNRDGAENVDAGVRIEAKIVGKMPKEGLNWGL